MDISKNYTMQHLTVIISNVSNKEQSCVLSKVNQNHKWKSGKMGKGVVSKAALGTENMTVLPN